MTPDEGFSSSHGVGLLPSERLMAVGATALCLGLALALVQSRWLGPLLFGVEAVDARALGIAATALLVVAAIACAIPGLAAARVRPIEALSAG